MPQSNYRCNVCEKKCNNRQSTVQCSNCVSWQHIRCTQLSKSQLSLYQQSNELYICQICINDIIPFQLLEVAEFNEIFNFYHNVKGVTNHITNILNQEPNLDELVKAVCKYRSVSWLKNCLSKSKKQRDLSIVHFNMRSLSKNKPVLEKLLCELDNFPDILAISETKLTDEKVNCAKILNYNFVFSNSGTNAGGVAFYIPNKLHFTRRHDLEFQTDDTENVLLK